MIMRVAMYYNNNDVRLEQMEKPVIKEGELLVKAMACGICGSDIMEWYRIKKAPLVLGHEMTGIIEESKNSKYKPGQRVFVSHHVPCGSCKYCKKGHDTACETLRKTNYYPGGFAEYVRVPETNVKNGTFVLPDDISYEDATLIEPLATVIRGQRLANIEKNDSVLILGSGIVGILHIQLAKLARAHVTATDISDYRLEMAKKFGADAAIKANDVKEKYDKVIVCSGSAAQSAFNHVDRGGTILFFAVPSSDISMPINELWKDEITIKTSYATGPQDIKEALSTIKKINAHDMITHKLGLAETGKGFKLACEAKEALKIVIEPQN